MKVILITGAASGLGWALARYWYQAGHRVVLADIDRAGLEQRCAQLADATRVLSMTTDVTRHGDLAALVAATEERFGTLDVLVNNAGITHRSPAHRTDPAVFRRVMAVDWQAPVELSLLALPLLQRSCGSIVNIGSMAGWMPVPGRAAYGAAKSALTQFFEVLRLELEPQNVHVLMVYPAFLDTPIEQNALGADGQPAAHARSTIGRMSSVEEAVVLIDRALQHRQPWLFPEPISRLGSLLWRIAPRWYLAMVRRKFAGELR